MFEVDENDKGTLWSQGSVNDVHNVISILTEIDVSTRVYDCKRLGKFKLDSPSPTPILAKMARPVDVLSILSKKGNLEGLSPSRKICQNKREIHKNCHSKKGGLSFRQVRSIEMPMPELLKMNYKLYIQLVRLLLILLFYQQLIHAPLCLNARLHPLQPPPVHLR